MTCDAKHCGTRQGYRHHGCRCPAGRRANTLDHKRYMLRRARQGMLLIDSTGTRRRIQALAAIGWSYRQMGKAGDLDAVHRILRAPIIHVDTAAKVKVLYELLSMRLPTPSSGATRARNAALAKGWLPPLVWDDDTIDDPNALPQMPEETDSIDEVAVQRALAGDRVELRREELLEAIRRGRDVGLTDRQIAERLGMKRTTVEHMRLRAGIPAQREAS